MTGNTAENLNETATELSSADTLVVVSKVKKYIRENAGLNTSKCAVDALTQKVIENCKAGIERAKQAGRKTLMGRDITAA